MAALRLSQVSKRFGRLLVVDGLTLQVGHGELLVLVGPSGCGKSTVLRMIAGLEAVTEGDIYLGDRWLNPVPPRDRDVAMVFQSYALYPHMSVRDNLSFGLRMRGVPRAETQRRVAETAGVLGLDNLLDRKPSQLSGGQRQRVALGRAMVREPQAFLMDEPLSNLDAQLRVQMRSELIRLQRRLGTTTVYVTHDQVEAMTMGQRVAVLRDGVLQQVDTPQGVYDRPANAFVAGFIGSPSMNFFQGELAADERGDLWVDGGGFRLPLPAEVGPAARRHVGRPVTFGIRPEHIGDPRQMAGLETARLRAQAVLVEPFGAGSYVHLQADGPEFIACFDARYKPASGDVVDVAVALAHIQLFDPESGSALLAAEAQVAGPSLPASS